MTVVAFKVLVLGGTSEGRLLAEQLARDPRYEVLLSFAGRTESLKPPAAPFRVGGFGGAAALAGYLRAHGFDVLIDATHPFAARMSTNAAVAAHETRVPLLRIEPPAWTKVEGDTWIDVADMDDAAHALGSEKRRVLLTIGRLEIDAFRAAPQHHYLVRAVEPFPIPLPDARLLAARGPFERDAERQLFEQEAIEVIVSKNAGTPGTYAKIEAARELGLPVIMVRRPRLPAAETVATRGDALTWLERAHVVPPAERGE